MLKIYGVQTVFKALFCVYEVEKCQQQTEEKKVSNEPKEQNQSKSKRKWKKKKSSNTSRFVMINGISGQFKHDTVEKTTY